MRCVDGTPSPMCRTTTTADKVLYGAGAFLINRPTELLNEMRDLPIPSEIIRKWLCDNAAHLLGITDDNPTA